MIRLQPRMFALLERPATIGEALQAALELEHSTIPPYLYAAYSLKASNREIRDLILDVAREEMLHMMLVANIMNAVGVLPRFDDPTFVKTYPTPLPGAVHGSLTVPLKRFSRALVEDVFLAIEQPEHPVEFPINDAATRDFQPSNTIGEFYRRLKLAINDAGPELFAHPSAPQVLIDVNDDKSIEVKDPATALRAIDFIVAQGEGTARTPFDKGGAEPAHYYRFKQLVLGKTLRPDATVKEGFSYGAPPIAVNEFDVYPVKANLRLADIPIDSPARIQCEDFARRYTTMLKQLQQAFGGDPSQMNVAANTMRNELAPRARQLVKLEIAPGVNAGPTFEYLA